MLEEKSREKKRKTWKNQSLKKFANEKKKSATSHAQRADRCLRAIRIASRTRTVHTPTAPSSTTAAELITHSTPTADARCARDEAVYYIPKSLLLIELGLGLGL